MKKFLISILFLSYLALSAYQVAKECDATSIKKELKNKLKPDFKYDSSKTIRFYYKTKKQQKEIEIPLYRGEKYRFMFNNSGVTRKGITLGIYTKKTGHRKRELLYELKPEEGKNIYTFEPKKSRKMYLTYSIPKSEERSTIRDCLVMVIGYQINFGL